MIKKHSDDPNIELAASKAFGIISEILNNLPVADSYDYGGHILKIGEYDICKYCASSIAEAQQAQKAVSAYSQKIKDPTVKEHLDIVADLFEREAQSAIIRAELHNGIGTENILNKTLKYIHNRNISDSYEHSHKKGL